VGLNSTVGLGDIERDTGLTQLTILNGLIDLRRRGNVGVEIEKTYPIDEAYLNAVRGRNYVKTGKYVGKNAKYKGGKYGRN
jgi:hypothetical protein